MSKIETERRIVNRCGACHYADYSILTRAFYCRGLLDRAIQDRDAIPDWCPLPDASRESMSLARYQELAQKTSGAFGDGVDINRQAMTLLALAGEVGEMCNLFKKMVGHGHDTPIEQFADELGDVLWYVAEAAAAFGYGLDGIAEANIAKLKRRYPDGFSEEASQKRETATEGTR
jgi:NTP pyrophosphatase (non-canonical NTP hydrolase)